MRQGGSRRDISAMISGVAILLLFGAVPVAASSGPDSPKGGQKKATKPIENPVGSPGWDFFFGMVGVADSNIDRTINGKSDYGIVPTFGLGWTSVSPSRKLEFRYEGAQHEYANTDNWDRYSQKITGLFEPAWRGRWSAQTLAEVTIKGSSEDRELADRYSLLQRFDFDLNRHQELRVYGAWRVRANNQDPGHDSKNPYGGVVFKEKFNKHNKLSIDYRYEDNRADVARNSYRRDTIDLKYEGDLSKADQLQVSVRYRDQYYYDRLIVVDQSLEYRQDDRWFLDLLWTRELGYHWEWWLAFEYENRASNDPTKEYDATALATALLYHW